jgi:hypothetical protein
MRVYVIIIGEFSEFTLSNTADTDCKEFISRVRMYHHYLIFIKPVHKQVVLENGPT